MASPSIRSPARSGWVYVLTNPAFPGLVKVGHTARHPETRAAELSSVTGVPARFAVAYAHQVKDHEAVEGLTHGRLDAYRTNANREFFRCSVGQARHIIEQEARAQLLPWWRVLLHRLAHPLPSRARRSAAPWRRRSRGGDGVGLLLFAGGGLGWVMMFRPWWVPTWLLHLVQQLPGLR